MNCVIQRQKQNPMLSICSSDFVCKYDKGWICTFDVQDWADIDFGVAEGVDFIAMSFVNDAEAIMELKKYISTKSAK